MTGFNTKAVLRQTGLKAETLLAWERRYGVVTPQRLSNGRRAYSNLEVHRLKLLTELVRRGFRIGEIAQWSDTELVEKLELSKKEVSKDHFLFKDIFRSLEKMEMNLVRQKLAKLRFELSPREIVFEIIPTLMYRIGVLIDKNEMSVAHEHAMSDLVRVELREIYKNLEILENSSRLGRKIVFATREGDFHEFGLLLSAIICRLHGFQCHYLGSNMPAQSLVEACDSIRPAYLILSASDIPREFETISFHDYFKQVDETLSSKIEIWIGGGIAHSLKRPKVTRTLCVFESLTDFEKKIKMVAN